MKHCILVLEFISISIKTMMIKRGAQLHSGRVLDLRSRGRRFEPHLRHCVVILSKTLIICLVLVYLKKTHPGMTENVLAGA